MRKNRVIEQNRCYHLVSRLAHRVFFLDNEEKDRAVALMRRVEAGVQASMSYCMEAVWRTSMIRKCFLAFALVLSGCKYSEKDDGKAWKAADCFAILSGELSQNSIEIAKFNMEKCLCDPYSVSYKFFDAPFPEVNAKWYLR